MQSAASASSRPKPKLTAEKRAALLDKARTLRAATLNKRSSAPPPPHAERQRPSQPLPSASTSVVPHPLPYSSRADTGTSSSASGNVASYRAQSSSASANVSHPSPPSGSSLHNNVSSSNSNFSSSTSSVTPSASAPGYASGTGIGSHSGSGSSSSHHFLPPHNKYYSSHAHASNGPLSSASHTTTHDDGRFRGASSSSPVERSAATAYASHDIRPRSAASYLPPPSSSSRFPSDSSSGGADQFSRRASSHIEHSSSRTSSSAASQNSRLSPSHGATHLASHLHGAGDGVLPRSRNMSSSSSHSSRRPASALPSSTYGADGEAKRRQGLDEAGRRQRDELSEGRGGERVPTPRPDTTYERERQTSASTPREAIASQSSGLEEKESRTSPDGKQPNTSVDAEHREPHHPSRIGGDDPSRTDGDDPSRTDGDDHSSSRTADNPLKATFSADAQTQLIDVEAIRDLLDKKHEAATHLEQLALSFEHFVKNSRVGSAAAASSTSFDAQHLTSALSFEKRENNRLQENLRHVERRLDRFREENRNLTRQLGVAARRVTEVREETNELCAQLRTSLDSLMAKTAAAEKTNAEERDVLTKSLRATLDSLADENQRLRVRLSKYENADGDGVGTPLKNAEQQLSNGGNGSMIVPVTNGLPLRSYDAALPSPSPRGSDRRASPRSNERSDRRTENSNGLRPQSDLHAGSGAGSSDGGVPSIAPVEDPYYQRGGADSVEGSSLRSSDGTGSKFFDDMPPEAYEDSETDAYASERQGGWMSWLGW